MIAALARPLPPMRALLWTAIACAAVAAYCLAYTALAGSSETLGQSLGWAASMIAPWLIAFEAQKRMTGWPTILAVLAAAMLLSLALGMVLLGQSADVFELVRRLPALLAVTVIVFLIRTLDRRAADRADPPSVDPVAVDWVRASGNYVEVHAAGRATVHRSTMSAVERQLRPHGFVRVHRSALVRRDRIARIRTEDVILHDGTSVKLGKRYRANLN